jgi:hypothetical protein
MFGDQGTASINLTMKFTEDTFLIYIDGKIIDERKILYKKNADDTWSTCLINGTRCEVVHFLDRNTMRMPIMPQVALTLKRI